MKSVSLSVQVAEIITKVKRTGDRALVFYARKFDGVSLSEKDLRVSEREIESSARELEPSLKRSLERAAANIRGFHTAEKRTLRRSWSVRRNGFVAGQVHRPIGRVGLYVPGGRFSYPSTVMMAAIPARVAGVGTIVMATPPGKMTPAVLYAARLSGVDAIYRVGGPAAVAALAYGTKTIKPVDIIVGPGNAYVNEAKRQVFGRVGVDSLAGPSEVAILADADAPVEYIVADLLAQAEHDPMARAYLVSWSSSLLRAVRRSLPASARRQVSFIACPPKAAADAVNRIAPEHLELMVRDPGRIMKNIRNAGAIFAGYYTPTAFGDYWGGPSHVLPTGGASRFSSGLSVTTFLKKSSVMNCTKNALAGSAPSIENLADSEGLRYHRYSVEARVRRGT